MNNPISRYLHRKEILRTTPFVIESDGKGYYIENGKKISKKDFEQKHDITVVPRVSVKGENPAAVNRWMNNNINFEA